MHIFGLTGGIACGKTTVANIWRSSGLHIVDADAISRRVMRLERVKRQIFIEFGDCVKINDAINRKALANIVFTDTKAKDTLERIMHPVIQSHVAHEFDLIELLGVDVACYDVPLLYEKGLDSLYSPVVVVSTTYDIQLARLMSRNTISELEAQKRISSQLPLSEKLLRADYAIDNSGTLDDLERQANVVLKTIKGYKWS